MREGSNAVHCKLQGKGDAILFIYGMPTSHKLWDEVTGQLSCKYRCFAIDLPGMGETPFSPYGRDYLDRMAHQIEGLRIQHGVMKWHVVGHDAGSAIAVQYASRFGRNVASLVLLSPAIFPDLKPFYLLLPLRKPLMGELLAPLVHFVFWQIAMRRAIAGEAHGLLRKAFYEPFRGLAGAWRLMRLVRWGRPEDMLGEMPGKLTELRMPTLIIHGTRDVLPEAFAKRAASLIQRSRLITLDAGHFVPLERPREVAYCLRHFFRENCDTKLIPIRARTLRKRSIHARFETVDPRELEGHRSVTGI
jgi:pimeloyl-ACP methyl ester carboxylesterase